MKNEIKLEDFRTPGAKIFTGRDRGAEVRKSSRIDEIEKENEKVIFRIPGNLYSINPSFFEELFINVVSKLGEKKFLEKFEFINEGDYNFQKPLHEAINRILREKTALD